MSLYYQRHEDPMEVDIDYRSMCSITDEASVGSEEEEGATGALKGSTDLTYFQAEELSALW